MDALNILREVATVVAKHKKTKEGADLGFKVNPNFMIFHNLHVRCPWCKNRVPTGRIFVLDVKRARVTRIWDIKNGKKIPIGVSAHPHVSSGSGAICFGNVRDAASVLTSGLNDTRNHPEVPRFLKGHGHICQGSYDAQKSYYGSVDKDWKINVNVANNEDKILFSKDETDSCAKCKKGAALFETAEGGTICRTCADAHYHYCDNCSILIADGTGDLCAACAADDEDYLD
jgi:hypothetical protein